MRHIKHCLVILLSCLLLSCSLVKTAYNKAPELTIWWLDDYFSFSQAQKNTLLPALQKLHLWHRQTQLPIYANQLRNIQTSFSNNQINADDVCNKLDSIRQSIVNIQMESIYVVLEIAPTLSDKQLERFKQKLTKRTEKWKDEWWQKTKPEQIAVRLEKATDFAEDIYGDLNEAQINQLKQGIESANVNPEMSYKEILRRNNDALDVLSKLQKPANNAVPLSQDENYKIVKTSFERIQNSPDSNYQSYADALTNHTCETFASLHASTTATQKLHAKNWLQKYIDLITMMQAR